MFLVSLFYHKSAKKATYSRFTVKKPSNLLVFLTLRCVEWRSFVAFYEICTKINRTHHKRKYVYDVSNFFIIDFLQLDFYKAFIKPCKSQKTLYRKDYLQASSIATATATVIPTMGLLPAPISPIISMH